MFAVSNLAGTGADWMIQRGASVTTTRKIMHCGALIVSAGLLLALQGVDSPTAALTMRDVGRPNRHQFLWELVQMMIPKQDARYESRDSAVIRAPGRAVVSQ
jgi:hypothetical protein